MINKKIIRKITLPLLAAIMIVASIPAFGVTSTAATTSNGSQFTSKTKVTRSLEGSTKTQIKGGIRRTLNCDTSYVDISEAIYDGSKWEHNSIHSHIDMSKFIPCPSVAAPHAYTCLGYGTNIVSRTGTSTYKSGKVYYNGIMESQTSHWDLDICTSDCVSDTTTTIESITFTTGDLSKTSTTMVSTTVTSHCGDSYDVDPYQTTSTTTTNLTETATYITDLYVNDMGESQYGSYALIELEGVSETVTKNSEGVVVSTMVMETFLSGYEYYELDCSWQPKVTVQYKGKTSSVPTNSFKFEMRKFTGTLVESRYNNGPSVYFHAQKYRNLDDKGTYLYKIRNTGTKKAGAKLDTHTLQYRVDVTHVGNGLLLIREARGGSKTFNIK